MCIKMALKQFLCLLSKWIFHSQNKIFWWIILVFQSTYFGITKNIIIVIITIRQKSSVVRDAVYATYGNATGGFAIITTLGGRIGECSISFEYSGGLCCPSAGIISLLTFITSMGGDGGIPYSV